jgi:hypothetical protein
MSYDTWIKLQAQGKASRGPKEFWEIQWLGLTGAARILSMARVFLRHFFAYHEEVR